MPGTLCEAGTMEAAQSDPLIDEIDEDGGIRIGDIYIPPPPLPCLTFDATGPRLMISEIIIENFKSYGGKVALGPFLKNFSAIVGPNGSGKSNVIDSMLFVFGYRAQKIRSQTVGVLIHSSDTYPNLTSCSVSVYFQKIIDKSGDEFDVVPGSKFVISRTAYKDNSSFYSIDNRKVPFKDVSRLLRSHGIDLDHNRFLILQGEVEQISLMKPKSPNEHDTGMLEFLEDIIGSGRFKEPIELLLKSVEELNEQRTEKLNRVKGVEKEKDELEGPMNEAVAYINTKNKVIIEKHILNQLYRYETSIKLKEKIDKKTSIEVEQGDFLKNFEQIENKLLEAEKEKVTTSKSYGKLCKRYEDQQKKINDLEILDMKKREELKHTNTRNKELVKALEQEKKKVEDLESAPAKLEEEIKAMQEKLDGELAQRKTDYEENEQKVMASLHLETKELSADKDRQEEKLMHLQKSVDEAQSKLGIAQVELDLYVRNGQNEENRLKEMQAANERNVETRMEMEREIKTLAAKLPQMQDVLAKDVADLESVLRKENETTELLTTQKIKLGEMTNAMQNSHNRGRVLEALMREKSEGRIQGIIGRLGDLGAIEEKYDIAISTACRPLDNIVTDTMASAETCVAFLKRHSLGQATFIALDKMQGWNEHIRKTFEPPAGVRRLFDLIKVKDKTILPAFYFALRDTLVANDIDQATTIGLQGRTRHRVVTLKGELIETSGTMSGGGNRPMRGRMGTSIAGDTISAEQVEDTRREVNRLQRTVDELIPKKLELQERVTEGEKGVQQVTHSLKKRQMEFEAITEELRVLKGQLKEQTKRAEATIPDEKRTKELTEKVKKEKTVFDKADEAATKIKTIIQELHDKINEISGNKLNKAQELVRNVNKEIDDMVSAANKKKVAIKTARRNYAKSREKVASMQTEIEENALKVDELKKGLGELDGLGTEALELQKELKDERKSVEKGLALINASIEQLSAELQEYKSKKMDIDHELKQLTQAIEERENKISHYTRQLSKMCLEEVEGAEPLELKELSEEELKSIDSKAHAFVLSTLEENLKNAKPNLSAIAEYYRKEKLYLQRVEEMDAITKQRDTQRARHDNLRKQRLNEFMKGFGIISQKLKETYQMLTMGGDAELELVNSLDPFSDGIVFSVRPPRKSWKNISNLSGGEKTLSSLALVFALHYYKPTPFYVMDEIDAALDFRNVTIVGHYIKEQTKNAQFIVISLRNNMFELADRLVGVYKTYNTSHSIAYDPRCGSQTGTDGTGSDSNVKMVDTPQR